MILNDALHLNNMGVFEWNASQSEGCAAESLEEPLSPGPVQPTEMAVLHSFTASLSAVQNDIQLLSAMQEPNASPRTTEIISFHAHTIQAFRTTLDENPSECFIFQRAFEAVLEDEGTNGVGLGLDDAVACSACVIFNMALVHHLRYLRCDRDVEAKSKAEQLYGLTLQALDGCAVSIESSITLHGSLQKVFMWVQLGALNNLGTLKCRRHEVEETFEEDARHYFLEAMRILNYVELEAKKSVDHEFHSLLDESEWNGLTSNCLAMLFNMRLNQKTAVAA